MIEVKIRYREVIATKPAYGRFGEYQVVQGRKVIHRTDTREQAERWCNEQGYALSSTDREAKL